MASRLVEEYFRKETLPNIWCPGCSNGTVTMAIVKAIDNLKLDKNKVVVVSGIGCSSRASGYLDFNTLHTTHGRAIAFATGVKFANPELTVIVITGDGDNAAIGGNHFIHAARRNIDITVVMYNNHIYGMTGGQASPTIPKYHKATTAPYGSIDREFDACRLAMGAGATYVARSTAYHVQQLVRFIERGIAHKGFAFIEAMSICPTYYGRRNRKGSPADMLKWLKDNSIDISKASKMEANELEGKIIIGEFLNIEAPEYTEEYQKMVERLKVNAK